MKMNNIGFSFSYYIKNPRRNKIIKEGKIFIFFKNFYDNRIKLI